ncbi:MAG: type II 3-dehydroquinate dehydratase [Defluviitaleaceae bacterium]|nr:type II 3-dehydroquinate dehydratase [Defluviitaleaceae bacterium]
MKIAVIHGPNLNMTGIRQVDIYGTTTFSDITAQIDGLAETLQIALTQFQSNHEGKIIDYLQACHRDGVDGIVINPGAFTHYSHAIGDAVASMEIPVVEVHLSNIHAREEFRQKSVIAPYCIGQISGFGAESYIMAIHYLVNHRRK